MTFHNFMPTNVDCFTISTDHYLFTGKGVVPKSQNEVEKDERRVQTREEKGDSLELTFHLNMT